jgi:hypothetical protein
MLKYIVPRIALADVPHMILDALVSGLIAEIDGIAWGGYNSYPKFQLSFATHVS